MDQVIGDLHAPQRPKHPGPAERVADRQLEVLQADGSAYWRGHRIKRPLHATAVPGQRAHLVALFE